MKIRLVRRQPETHNIESFFWQPLDPDGQPTKMEFKAGQFLKWNLRDDNPDERGNSRFFTISASPTEPELRNTTKFNPEGSSFKKALAALSIGDEIDVFGPMGPFILPENPAQPIVLVAGGIGVTPFRSMIKYLVDSAMTTPVQLLYACRSDQDIAFKAEFDMWAQQCPWLSVTYILSDPPVEPLADGGKVETEKLTGQRILDLTGSQAGKLYYLSGPEPMVKALADELKAIIGEESVKTDYFPGYIEH
jgi:ferredoxin-NADP reductase